MARGLRITIALGLTVTAAAAADPEPAAAPRPAAVPAPPAQAAPPAVVPAAPRILAADLFSGAMASPKDMEVRMGDDYVLGAGDQVALTTFGSLALSKHLTVDRGGKVAIPEVGILDLGGLTLAGARASVRAMLARRHAGVEQFNLEVVGLHDVQVFLIGEVVRPGSFLVPGSSSAVTLLGLAGGPGPQGTWRNVQHLRAGKVIRTLDLYALRFEGAGLQGPGFQNGDCLFVPLAGKRVLAKGAFRRTPEPAGVLMELKEAEGAAEAVRFAGGLVPSASRMLVTVQRTSPEGLLSVTDVPAQAAGLAAARLEDADVLVALQQRRTGAEFVELAGAVAVPGRFAFREGMAVHDLLTLKARGDQVLPRTYRARGEVLRTLPDGATRLFTFDLDGALRGDPRDDLVLQAEDHVELTDLAALRPSRTVTVRGPLARPGAYAWHEGMRASDLLFKAGVPELRASLHEAELARFRAGGSGAVLRLDLARLLATEAGAPVRLDDDAVNPRLGPYDQITVYEDPSFRLHPTVLVTGQVRRPGPYVLTGEASTLSQLVLRAGGLTADAMPSGGVFLRARPGPAEASGAAPEGEDTAKAGSQAAMDAILQRLAETRRGKDTGALEPNPLLHGLLAGDLNRLVVDFPAALGGDARQDVALLDGDRVHIPRRSDSVYVVGEVASAYASFHVKPGDRVKDVLKLAGGYTRNADVAQVRLLKACGRVVDGGVGRAAMEPGDALLVPQRIRKDVPWQDSLLAMTPLAILYNALRR